MNSAATDRDILLGILAFRAGVVSREAMDASLRDLTPGGSRPLGQVLVDRGAITEAGRSALEALADEHVRAFGGDPARSLASFDAETLRSWVPTDRLSTLPGGVPGGTTRGATAEGPDSTRDAPGPGQEPPTGQASPAVRYRLLRLHARGGLGDLFVAHDEELNREVALKLIREKNAHDPRIRSRFVAEAEITGHLEHPGVVPVYGLGYYDDGRPYYAMRFIRGVSLATAIEKFHAAYPVPRGDLSAHGLEFRKLLRRFLDACDAISYAHSRGVLHRDIKPDNIMLGKYGETLVVDWGLAKLIDAPESSDIGAETMVPRSSDSGSHATIAGSAMGTPAYMSPEQASGAIDRLGPASDVYSLGATLYCLLANRPPFVSSGGDDVEALLGRVRSGDFPHPRSLRPEVARALDAVCLKAMALEPGDRYLSPRALADDVERWLADAPVSAWREPLSVRAGRWVTRHRSTMATAGAVIVVALVCAGYMAVVESRANRMLADANRRLQATNRLAMDAVKAYYTGMSEDLLLKQPQFEDLRKKLLSTPLEFYRRLKDAITEGRGPDPQARADLGEAYHRVAAITDEIGDKGDALTAYEQALAIYERLSLDHPDDPTYQRARAECLDGLAAVQYASGATAATLRSRHSARDLWRAQANAHPDDLKVRRAEAASLRMLGQIEFDTGQYDDALRTYSEARTILKALLVDHPDDLPLRSDLVNCLNRISLVQSKSSLGEALRTSDEALAQLKEMERVPSDDPRVRYDQAMCYRYIGFLQIQAGNSEDALRTFERARSIHIALVNDHPAVTEFRIDLAACQLHLAGSLKDLGRLGDAKREISGALELTQVAVRLNPTVVQYQTHLAWCYNGLARIDELADRLDEALRSFKAANLILEALARDHPDLLEVKLNRVQGFINIGRVQAKANRLAQARESLEAARDLVAHLLGDRPDESDFHTIAGEALWELTGVLNQLNRPLDEVLEVVLQAAHHWRTVFRKATESTLHRRKLSLCLHYLAQVYRKLGRPAEAAATDRERRDLLAGNGPELFSIVVDLTRCIPLVGPGKPQLTPADRDERRWYADQAVATLRLAIEAGFQDVNRLQTTPELDPLRARADFQRMVLEVMDRAFPRDPFQHRRPETPQPDVRSIRGISP